jgi:RecA/RadA recombinase
MFEKESKSRKIVTFCQELDAALGGGIATGQVTELCEWSPDVIDRL